MTRRVGRPIVYVAGPFRADSAWGSEQNIRRAEELALRVWEMGAAALCPHTNTRFFTGALPDSVWLDGDLDLLAVCGAVVLGSGWKSSSGTAAEIARAQQLGIPVFDSVDEFGALREWVAKANEAAAKTPDRAPYLAALEDLACKAEWCRNAQQVAQTIEMAYHFEKKSRPEDHQQLMGSRREASRAADALDGAIVKLKEMQANA